MATRFRVTQLQIVTTRQNCGPNGVPTKITTFRLTPNERVALCARAASLGLATGEYIRRLIVADIEQASASAATTDPPKDPESTPT